MTKTYYEAHKEEILLRTKLYRAANPDKIKEQRIAFNLRHPTRKAEQDKKYRLKNLEKLALQGKIYRETHKEELAAYAKENAWKYTRKEISPEKREIAKIRARKWAKDNPERALANNKRRELDKIQRLPQWADIGLIKEIYKNCPRGYHVDHILPLQGEYVSGLHVEYNLQYLTPEENLKKSNIYPHPEYHI